MIAHCRPPLAGIGFISTLCPFVMLATALTACAPADAGTVATGSIELTQTDVAPTVPARVVRVVVDEGAEVRRGDTLVILLPGRKHPSGRGDAGVEVRFLVSVADGSVG